MVTEGGFLTAALALEQQAQTGTHVAAPVSVPRDVGGGEPGSACLENPRDGGSWWAAVYGAAQSRTQLTRLRSSSVTILSVFILEGALKLTLVRKARLSALRSHSQ